MALAHHLLVVVYQVLSRKEEYVEMGGDYYDQRNKPKVVSRLVMRLTRLGYYVDLRPVEPDTSSPVSCTATGGGHPGTCRTRLRRMRHRAQYKTQERPALQVRQAGNYLSA